MFPSTRRRPFLWSSKHLSKKGSVALPGHIDAEIDVLDALFLLFFLGKNWSILWGRFAGRVIQCRRIMQQV